MPIGQVLCLGGSLTVGDDAVSASFRTFRGALQNNLATAGLTLNFVGPNQAAAAAGGSDADHAGWVNASIDSTGSSGNNLTDRLASLKSAFPSPDLIIIDPPWWDIANAPSSLATRYSTFIGAVQSGAWASAKILMCTAHPASGQTAAQTAGAYAAFGPVNAAIAALRNAAPSTRFVADLAALQTTTGGSSATLTERALWFAQRTPDDLSLEGGGQAANPMGGYFVCNWKGIVDYNATWTSNIPRNPNGSMLYPPPGGTGLMDFGVSSWNGSTNRFVQSAAGITPWYWIYCGAGHNASNTCVEIRNGFAAALTPTQGWQFFFAGSRFGDTGTWWNGTAYASGPVDSRARWGQRGDGLTTWHAPRGNVGIEVWPRDTVPSRGILEFNGGFNRNLLVNSLCWWWGGQCRLALIDPNGPDDRSRAHFIVKCGGDVASSLGGRHYDQYGWPYNMQDLGSDAWTRVTWTDWELVSGLSLGREGSPSSGPSAEYHWNDQGAPGPMFGWSPPTPFNDPSAGRSLTASQIRNTYPLPIPPFWEGGGGSGGTAVSGYQVADYFLPSGGSRLFLLTQSGADKIASIMSTAIVSGGLLAGFTGGGVIFEPMPGRAVRPNVYTRTTGGLVNVEPKNWAEDTLLPDWQTTSLPPAAIGVAYSVQLAVTASPAATFTIVSGAPGWLSLSSGGLLTGTPTGAATTHSLVLRATNSAGSTDRVLSLAVVAGVAIATTTLPNAVQGIAYSQALSAVGIAPFTWAITVGALPPGLTLAGGLISGVPTAAVAASFTVRVTDATGATATRALTLTVGTTGQRPAITTTTLSAGTVAVAYSQLLAATGAGPITWAVVSGALPPGVTLNASTGAITGTPSAQGGYAFTVRAANAFGFADAALYLTIAATATPPVASPWAQFVRQ